MGNVHPRAKHTGFFVELTHGELGGLLAALAQAGPVLDSDELEALKRRLNQTRQYIEQTYPPEYGAELEPEEWAECPKCGCRTPRNEIRQAHRWGANSGYWECPHCEQGSAGGDWESIFFPQSTG